MTHNNLMRSSLEALAILLLAAVLGIIWNHSLLLSAWRGEATTAAPSPPAAAGQQSAAESLPLPLGLMQAKELYDSKEAVLVDARDAATFAEGHIAGALSLPLGSANSGAAASFREAVPKDKTLVVYCSGFSCHDSMDLGKILMKWGYRNVYIYEGGYPEWQDAGYPVQRGVK